MREIPRGVLTVRAASLAVVVASVLFAVAAGALGALCLALSPLALGWIFLYSYTKRFTRFAHLALGLGMSIAPVGGYLAVTGAWSRPWWVLCALALAVLTWGGGFDILYALPDIAFDREHGLHSLPVALGARRALYVARTLHVGTVGMLAAVGVGALPQGSLAATLFWCGVALVAILLTYEHALVKADDLSRLDAAFFTMNGVISLSLFAFVLAGRLLASAPVGVPVVSR